jgi:tRNA/rRNA methyltransferase
VVNPFILLIQPQLPENIGAVARAMMNFGLTHLRLVAPLADPLDPKAIATAAGADDLLHTCQIFESFEAAVADLHIIYGTCATLRHMIKPYLPLKQVGQKMNQQEGRLGILFGPERTGLNNEQLARCHGVIQIPTDPEFSSLNLAQAVLLVGYELFQAQHPSSPWLHTGETSPATQDQIFQWLQFLETTLDQVNFWRVPSKKAIMWRNMMNIFTRIELTEQEIRTLYGLIECLQNPRKQ